MLASMTSKGQVTVPKDIRDRLKLKAGDRVDFQEMPDGSVVMRAANLSALDIIGILARPGQKPVSVEEMNEGIAEAIRERYERSKG